MAFDCGSVPEVIDDGVSGYIASNIEDAVRALGRLDALSRRGVRNYFEERFSVARMTNDYVNVYRSLIDDRNMRGDRPIELRKRDMIETQVA